MNFTLRVKTYLGVIGGLAVLLVLGLWFSPAALLRSSVRPPLLSFNKDMVGRIELSVDLTVLRRNNVWEVSYKGQTLPAMRERVDSYMTTLQELTQDLVVRSSSGPAPEFGIGPDTWPITGKTDGGTVLFEIFPGSGSLDGRRIYVQTVKDGPVFLTDRRAASTLELDLQSWVDNRVFLGIASEATIERISLSSDLQVGEETVGAFTLNRTAVDGVEVWQNASGVQEPDGRATATRVFNSRAMSHILTADWPANFIEIARFTVQTEDGGLHELVIGAKDEQNRWPTEIRGRRLWLGDWNVRDLAPRATPEPTPPPGG